MYPYVVSLLSSYLTIKDRTRCRSIVSSEWSTLWGDMDVLYNKELSKMTYIMQIIRCEACTCWRKYHNVNHNECGVCYRLLCSTCSKQFYNVGMCNDCYQ